MKIEIQKGFERAKNAIGKYTALNCSGLAHCCYVLHKLIHNINITCYKLTILAESKFNIANMKDAIIQITF